VNYFLFTNVAFFRYYENPEEFRPERFLDASKRSFLKPEFLTPFGVGKRMCPGNSELMITIHYRLGKGEALGRGEAFIFLAALVKKFRFQRPANHSNPSGEVEWGLARVPAKYWIQVTERKQE